MSPSKKYFKKKLGLGRIAELPDNPGVYFFLDSTGGILYIGKATSLRDRVRSYFSSDIAVTRGPKIVAMLEKAAAVGFAPTDSVLEAILLESRRIKEVRPPYNTDLKDDKSYNSVVITEEDFPRVLVVRGRELAEGKAPGNIRSMYGPFPNGLQLREAMKIIRHIFPFRDRCTPANNEQRAMNKKQACFNRQIGLCPGVCTGEISKREYAATLRNIGEFFEGKKASIAKRLEREMKHAANELAFERAGEIKKTLFALGHIQDVALIKEHVTNSKEQEVQNVRIEAYDVAHLAGSSTVGVMTVVSNGIADKNEYRKFRLRKEYRGDDLRALEEVLRRRFAHSEWTMPDMVAVDGALLQFGVAEKVLDSMKIAVPIVGVVKNERHRPERIIGDPKLSQRFAKEIYLANAEAHRFAIGYHRKRRGKAFLS